MGLFKPLYWLFGVCMGFLMDLLNNQYFVAIVIFTVVTRVILLPFNIHQQKTMAKTARLQPKLAKLQKWIKSPLVDDSGTPLTQYIFIRSIDRGSELIYTVTQERQDTVYKCTKRVTEKVDYR